MTEPPISDEAVEAAAKTIYDAWGSRSGASGPLEGHRLRARQILAAAYPHLRRQIEAEVRGQVAGEIEQMESAWYFGGPRAPGVRVVSQEGALQAALQAARGATQTSPGTDPDVR